MILPFKMILVRVVGLFCLLSKSTLILVLFLFHRTQLAQSVSHNCPKACQKVACQAGALDCQNGGLSQIPEKLPDNTIIVLLLNQRFDSSRLMQHNFRYYRNYNITKMTIRNCSINYIEPMSFSQLTRLLVLDLSANRIKEIFPNTFSHLSLSFLRLDRNRNLHLRKRAFQKLQVTKLSMIDCDLTRLDYDIFDDISDSLKRLNLAQNKLRTIDPKFGGMFRNLKELELNNNQLECSCDMLWLTKILKYRYIYITSQSNGAPPPNSKAIGGGGLTTSAATVKCARPPRLAGRYVYSLKDSEYVCGPPTLVELDIALYDNDRARLSCIVSLIDDLQIYWQRIDIDVNSNKTTAIPLSNTITRGTNSTIFVSRSNPIKLVNNVKPLSYICMAKNLNGNSSAEIRINWPSLLDKKTTNENIVPPYNGITTSNSNSDNSNNNINDNKFMYHRQFTLLEMIGAVVGTFTFTLLLFLLAYRILIHKVRHQRNRKRKLYETVLYSDSHTYDIPHHYNTTHPLQQQQQQQQSSQPPPPPPPQQSQPEKVPQLQPYYHPIQYTSVPNNNSLPPPISPAHYLDFKNPPQIINNHLQNTNHLHSGI